VERNHYVVLEREVCSQCTINQQWLSRLITIIGISLNYDKLSSDFVRSGTNTFNSESNI
jgi:hypothetical protein